MNRLSCIGIGLLALGALAAGCGTGESIESSASGLVTAPAAFAELDLPGCEVLAQRSARSWEMLGHPQDSGLVVVTGDGCPVCVDTRDGAKLQLGQRLSQPVTLESLPAGVDPGDESAGTDGDEATESGTREGMPTTTAVMVTKRSLISDDPLPPPGNGRPALTAYAAKQ